MENQALVSERERVVLDSLGIRAGLSVISKCTDGIRQEEKFQEREKSNLENIRKAYNNSTKRLKELESQLQSNEIFIQQQKKDLESYSNKKAMTEEEKIELKERIKRETPRHNSIPGFRDFAAKLFLGSLGVAFVVDLFLALCFQYDRFSPIVENIIVGCIIGGIPLGVVFF